jgi:serine/threonine protein phosphatase PrpC
MKLSDPYKVRRSAKFTFTINVYHEKKIQKDREYAIEIFQDECIVIADGIQGTPYNSEATCEAAQYALWYYKLAKRKHSLWNDRDQFSKGMFRSVNLSMLKEKKRKHIQEGFYSTLSVLWFGTDSYTVFHIGASRVFLFREGSLLQLTTIDRDEVTGSLTAWLGDAKTPHPSITHGKIQKGDVLLIVNEGIADWISEQDILNTFFGSSCNDVAFKTLMSQASHYGGTQQKVIISVTVH